MTTGQFSYISPLITPLASSNQCYSFLLCVFVFIFIFIRACVCALCMCGSWAPTVYVWRPEDSFLGVGSLFQCVGPKAQTQLIRLSSKHLSPLSLLASPSNVISERTHLCNFMERQLGCGSNLQWSYKCGFWFSSDF